MISLNGSNTINRPKQNLDIIKITMGSGSGSVGRAVASDTRDQRSAKYYIEPKIKKKEARIG